MHWTFLVIALVAQHVTAQSMLRFACSQLVVERTDPLVDPGKKFTSHLHQIVGGNSFNLTMDPATHDPAALSTCTSCSFAEDLSNYWTAVLFFKNRNGSFIRVPQVGNGGPQGRLINKGGLDVYYIPRGEVTAFKKGFRMIAGSPNNKDTTRNKGNICNRCWTSANENKFVGGPPCTGSDSMEVPADPSCKMIRQTVIFPHCWDGKNLDSPDHASHVSYGGSRGASGGGRCPSSHPVKLPQVMYEIMWNVTEFSDRRNWPADGSKPFQYSTHAGGASAHGDYIFGWKGDSLQKAMDNKCNLNRDCPKAGLHALKPQKYDACTLPQQAPEPVDGWLKRMPGAA